MLSAKLLGRRWRGAPAGLPQRNWRNIGTSRPGNPMTTSHLNQSAFALGFRTIDCALNGGLDPISVSLALRFLPPGLLRAWWR
jgi:hypothetical protein